MLISRLGHVSMLCRHIHGSVGLSMLCRHAAIGLTYI